MLKLLTLPVTLFLLLSVQACSLLPEQGTTESLALNYLFAKSTTAVIDRGAATPLQVLEAVEDARQYIQTGDSVTIATLYQGALERIGGLDPADRILVTAILDNVRARLETAISTGQLDESERVALLDVLNWIERAARDANL